jgi:CHAT domain-containing protein
MLAQRPLPKRLQIREHERWCRRQHGLPACTGLRASGRRSASKLAQYRVLHFATHGTLAGEIEGTYEPGLILTPPREQSDLDDGYLSASEIASLKLDADWVILSACNTAAGGAKGAEALSGLARAFFYAGARGWSTTYRRAAAP